MKPSLLFVAITLGLIFGASAEEVRPFATEETLHYAVNWPSGLSLGEASMSATHAKGGEGKPPRWTFEFRLDAAVPGVKIADEFLATATDELCSLEFEKTLKHGKRATKERITFHQSSGTATRETLEGGGSSEIPVGECAKDAVTFLYHLRDELSRGRIPSSQTVLFGAAYEVSFEHVGEGKVQLGGTDLAVDKLLAKLTGPASEVSFMLTVSQGSARELVQVHVPLELGNFTMQLMP